MSVPPGNRFLRYLRRLGAGSLLISIIIHVIVLLGATVYVISSVQEKRKASFQGGSGTGQPAASSMVEHRVQMSHQQQNLSTITQRLAVDSPNAAVSLPDLPDMPGFSSSGGPTLNGGLGGSGIGSGAGLGKGPVMPSFGFREAQPGGSLRGYLYDFKQNPQKQPNPLLARIGPQKLAIKEVTAFINGGCREDGLRQFLRSPTPLFATQLFVPVMSADEAPKAYGVEKYVQPTAWMAHYKGRVSPPKSGVYRFVGAGDDLMAVRLDGKLVLDCGGDTVSSFKTDQPNAPAYGYSYQDDEWNRRMRGGFVVGNRMELRAGLFYDIDVVFSEGPGGKFCAMLLIQEEGVTYAKDDRGNPVLPIFRVADGPPPPASRTAPPFLANGPVWRSLPPR